MLSIPRITRIGTAALGAAVLCVLLAFPAGAQTPTGDIQSVGVSPTESKPDDPNAGQWFIFSIAPGASGATKARITNPADQPQVIKLYLTDLVFGPDGTPTIPEGDFEDVGTWGHFETASITVPARSQVLAPFTVTVPANAEPGDHVGAAVVESEPLGDTLKIVKRIATRLYVTVPGDATKSYAVVSVTNKVTSKWFPKSVAVTTLLRNTGRVRIRPVVKVGGTKAAGADLLLAQSVETYTAKVPVPWYGGPVRIPVAITSEAGNRQLDTSVFVVPYGNVSALVVGALFLFALRRLSRLRGRKVRGLQADLKRLEKMVAERQTGADAANAALAEHAGDGEGESDDAQAERVRSIRSGIKRARRNHAQEPLERLSLSLHDTGEDALDDLVAALEHAEGARRDVLIAAAASYGAERLASMADLPEDLVSAAAPIRAATPTRTSNGVTSKATAPSHRGTTAAPRARRRPAAAADRAGSDAGTASDPARTAQPAPEASDTDADAAPRPSRKPQAVGAGRRGRPPA
ncbi:MAG TPA: hypothetical protein VM143_12920 [Acidimicrobiales bacterium]|nr:hypothetical protein [Acidimicrobiales bacterium]